MPDRTPAPDAARLRICFLFNAQRHQLLHGLPTAVALARLRDFEVWICSPSGDHIDYARRVVGRLGGAPTIFWEATSFLGEAARGVTGEALPPKVLSLALLAPRLSRFDAIATPERTSILLRRLGVTSPLYIHLDHGTGDRAAGFDTRIRDFDFVLMAGEKHRERMTREGLIRPRASAVVGYPKFEAADAMRNPRWRRFDDRRPTVVYNPHFSSLGSWDSCGEAVLDTFAGQDRYNLIVAPHLRMLVGRARATRWRALASAFAGASNIHIDTGSDRLIDMTYTTLADVYLGDVSSQVYEFLRTPRPCVFLDAHGVDWTGDENYAHWRFGPVVRAPHQILEAVDHAIVAHWHYLRAQMEGVDVTFSTLVDPPSVRAATAIAEFLRMRVAG